MSRTLRVQTLLDKMSSGDVSCEAGAFMLLEISESFKIRTTHFPIMSTGVCSCAGTEPLNTHKYSGGIRYESVYVCCAQAHTSLRK